MRSNSQLVLQRPSSSSQTLDVSASLLINFIINVARHTCEINATYFLGIVTTHNPPPPQGGKGGTLGISGWGCAAGTLEPLDYTRASYSFSWILLPYTRVNCPNHSYPRVPVFQKLRSLAHLKQSGNKTLYHNHFFIKKRFIYTCPPMPNTYVRIIKTIKCLYLTSSI